MRRNATQLVLVVLAAATSLVLSVPQVAAQASNAVPLVIGHRGASGYRPEHTLAAYTLAIEQGADFVEPDLVSTADGILVVRHENEIGGTTDVERHPEFAARRTTKTIDGEQITGWFTEDFTLKELKTLRARERIPQLRAANVQFDGQFDIPTFEEVIELVRAHNDRVAVESRSRGMTAPLPVGLYLEIKHSTYFDSLGKPLEPVVVQTLRRAGLDSRDAPVFIQSFETGNLRRLKEMTNVRLIQLLADEGAPYDLRAAGSAITYADLVKPAGLNDIATYAYGIGAAKELVIPRSDSGELDVPTSLVQEAHARGLKVHVWTFRRENVFLPVNLRSGEAPGDSGDLGQEIEAFVKAGIDGVFSDNPDIAIRSRN